MDKLPYAILAIASGFFSLLAWYIHAPVEFIKIGGLVAILAIFGLL